MTEYRQFYSEEDFWKKVKHLPRRVGRGALERALTLYVLLTDREIPAWGKVAVLAALGYFIAPLDLIPDYLPGVGYMDDIAVMALVIDKLGTLITPDVRKRARELAGTANPDTKPKISLERKTKTKRRRKDERRKDSRPDRQGVDGPQAESSL